MLQVAGLVGLIACAPPVQHDAEVRGTVLASWSRWSYRDPSTRRTLRQLRQMGANEVAVLSTWYQPDLEGSAIAPDPERTPDVDALLYALGEAREQGFRVTVKPHLDVVDGRWRGEIRPADGQAWFDAYTAFIVHHAEIARDAGADALVVGTEMKATEQDERWRGVFAAAREVFDGDLLYAANWDSYEAITWWDEASAIGVDAYFPLSNSLNPANAVIRDSWARRREEIDRFAAVQGKDVVFTEFGYQDYDGTNTTPWWAPTDRHDADEQVVCLEAAFEAMAASDAIRGGFVWKTYYNPDTDPDGFDVLGKPAERVLREAWAR